MKVFFNPKQSTDSHGYSPSGSKPAAAVADWISRGLDIEIINFAPATETDLCLAHDPKFVRGVLSCKLPNGHGNRIQSVTNSCLWTCGSLVASVREALNAGITCSPTSGFHHAGHSYNGSFCTFNGLVIAARKLINEGAVSRVGILDCDQHYSDGTIDILDKLELHDVIQNWTFGDEFGHRGDFRQKVFLERLGDSIDEMKDDGVELVILQAGADPHVNDPLSSAGMTSEEMRERDRFVFTTCHELGIPVCFCLAGGYQRDADGGISKVLELHRATVEEAIQVLNVPRY
jgi:acetoin utilization deacetylase AcuC-like enzyme